MDSALRNRLWNALDLYYWRIGREQNRYYNLPDRGTLNSFFIKLYHHHFKIPVDTIPVDWEEAKFCYLVFEIFIATI